MGRARILPGAAASRWLAPHSPSPQRMTPPRGLSHRLPRSRPQTGRRGLCGPATAGAGAVARHTPPCRSCPQGMRIVTSQCCMQLHELKVPSASGDCQLTVSGWQHLRARAAIDLNSCRLASTQQPGIEKTMTPDAPCRKAFRVPHRRGSPSGWIALASNIPAISPAGAVTRERGLASRPDTIHHDLSGSSDRPAAGIDQDDDSVAFVPSGRSPRMPRSPARLPAPPLAHRHGSSRCGDVAPRRCSIPVRAPARRMAGSSGHVPS
jgi:hypothetical protein